MTLGTVTQKLRPLRLALLVNPAIREDLQRAIEISSTFWGGCLNPIIPCFRGRVPSFWSRERAPKPKSAREIADGYLDCFDPDLIVPVSDDLDSRFTIGNREVVTPAELFGNVLKSGSVGYGVGAVELAQYLADKEFKFKRTTPLDFILPNVSGPHKTFLSSVFGAWPSEINGLIKQYFGPHLGLTEPTISVRNFETFLEGKYLFPRRVGLREIDYNPRDACIYCLDATKSIDIIDFWNLRAAGGYVIPAPKQAFSSAALRAWVKEFVESNYSEEHRSFRHTTFQVGRTLREADVKQFIAAIGVSPPEDPTKDFKCATRTWYPRLWDKWARENTNERSVSFYAGDSETSFSGDGGRVDLKTLTPAFPSWSSWEKSVLCVNEIGYSIFGSPTPMAEVLPEGSRQLAANVLFSGINEVRLARSGLTYSIRPNASRISFQVPEAEPFMLSWLRTLGWNAELSSPGLLAKQVLARLKGMDGIHAIDSERLLRLLDRLASEKLEHNQPGAPRSPKWIAESALTNEANLIIKEKTLFFDAPRYVRRLVESSVVGLGLELHCPTCLRWMWRSVDTLSANIECEQCLTSFPIAHAPKEERVWSYKPTGPFNVRNFAGGAYPVLFALKFFEGTHRRSTTPLLSFRAKKENLDCEVDLALFCEDGRWDAPRHELLLVECKAYDAFRKKDVYRMESLSREFPGAVIVFCKFETALHPSEIDLISKFVVRQRKLWLTQKPHASVMLLTGNELFSRWGAPECWKDATGVPKGTYEKWSHVRSLGSLAEATQQIYLGIPSLHDWADAYFKRRRKRTANP